MLIPITEDTMRAVERLIESAHVEPERPTAADLEAYHEWLRAQEREHAAA